jgi:hypothetical protein
MHIMISYNMHFIPIFIVLKPKTIVFIKHKNTNRIYFSYILFDVHTEIIIKVIIHFVIYYYSAFIIEHGIHKQHLFVKHNKSKGCEFF